VGILFLTCLAWADTSINNTNKYAYGANIGWINFQGDTNNGAYISQFFCTGYVWSANCGWIHIGKGPTNGWQYSNASAGDYGVNVVGSSLRGFAYGANIGWINFESNGNPRVNLISGALEGFAYGANVGWISLSNNFAFVKTDSLDPGPDTDGDGIPDAWEYAQVGNLTNLTASGDFDGDGVPDRYEYYSDTNPNNINEFLQITAHAVQGGGSTSVVTWASEPSRLYNIHRAASATNNAAWADSGLGTQLPDPGDTTTRNVPDGSVTTRFYRVQAIVPLTP
jgi:hypothetical protein